jgi:hypothetical protein
VKPPAPPVFDRNDERLRRACELLTQVADDLQADLQVALRNDIPVARAGAVIRLACQIEELNQLAAQAWAIRDVRFDAAIIRARLEAS